MPSGARQPTLGRHTTSSTKGRGGRDKSRPLRFPLLWRTASLADDCLRVERLACERVELFEMRSRQLIEAGLAQRRVAVVAQHFELEPRERAGIIGCSLHR